MNYNIRITFKLIIGIISFSSIKAFENQEIRMIYPNGIAAVVESRVITLDELHRKLGPYVRQLQKEASSREDFEAKIASTSREVLDGIIDDILIVNEFKSNKKLKIPLPLLENHYTKFKEEQFQGNRSHYLQHLEDLGITDRDLREQQKDQMIIGYIRSQWRKSEAEISPKLINQYYDEHRDRFVQKDSIRLRQIVLKGIEGIDPKEGLLQKAQEVIDRLKKGQNFAEVAREVSDDDMRTSGGDWGWINRSDIREELAIVAFALNKSTFSDAIILDNYAFILFVEDKKNAGIIPVENVREDIEKILVNENAKKTETQHIQKLRKKAFIKYHI